ncbi:SDR family oxidoreductase [Sporosarcina sp. CAU 1771]
MSTHFFTGFPGFIASQIIKELISKGKATKIYALVQPSQMGKAIEKADALMDELEIQVPFEVISGDITELNLGMKEKELEKLEKEALTVWHLAAIYDLAVKEEIAWKVNVEGTKQVNAYLSAHPRIVRYMYFSTAYVAGMREGALLETELIRPESFKNHYEETKFEAELLVEHLKKSIPVTIIRPGIVRGNSKTGETIKFDGPYFFMNMIDRLKWMPLIPYIGKMDVQINVVPIDYIIDATVFLSGHPQAAGCTVHLTDPAPHPIREVYEAMVMELTGKKPKGRLPYPIAEKGLSSKKLQRLLGVEVETLGYLTWNATFDTTVAEQLLEGSTIQCADFIDSIPAMTDFYRVHKSNSDYHVQIQ